MNCWTCGVKIDPPFGKLSFRAVCEQCGAALHCCHNCRYYKPGQPNDCQIPGTDPIRDRSLNNYCEEFSLLGKGPSPKEVGRKDRFNDLFK